MDDVDHVVVVRSTGELADVARLVSSHRLDVATGQPRWSFQTVHHDIWDYDLPPAPGLIDIVRNGRTIPALAQVGKTGYMFILDRVTGKPVFGVEERPVPPVVTLGGSSRLLDGRKPTR